MANHQTASTADVFSPWSCRRLAFTIARVKVRRRDDSSCSPHPASVHPIVLDEWFSESTAAKTEAGPLFGCSPSLWDCIRDPQKITASDWRELSREHGIPAPDLTGARARLYLLILSRGTDVGELPDDPEKLLHRVGYWLRENRSPGMWGLHMRGMGDLFQSLHHLSHRSSDRELLALPADAPLTAAVVRESFRTVARNHHPDTGGDPAQFRRLAEARDRLLQSLTSQEVQ